MSIKWVSVTKWGFWNMPPCGITWCLVGQSKKVIWEWSFSVCPYTIEVKHEMIVYHIISNYQISLGQYSCPDCDLHKLQNYIMWNNALNDKLLLLWMCSYFFWFMVIVIYKLLCNVLTLSTISMDHRVEYLCKKGELGTQRMFWVWPCLLTGKS